MKKQHIHLTQDGVVGFGRRMKLFHPSSNSSNPSNKLHRLQKLLKTKTPSICFVRGEGIGDVIMTTPSVAAIKEIFPQSSITFATNTRYLDGALVKVLQYNPDIDNIIERDTLNEHQYDLIINLHCPAIAHEQPGKFPPNRIDLFAQHAGIQLKDPVPKYYIQKADIEYGQELLNKLDPKDKKILVQVQASSEKRSFSNRKLKESLVELSETYGIKPIILTHSSSDHPNDIVWNGIPGSTVLNDLNIRQISGVMVHCDLVLCPDSSILHLAGALQMPCVGLFGPTPPTSRINHYKNTVAVWRGDKIAACPCWYSSCPTKYSCWEQITIEDIVETCLLQLNNTTKLDISEIIKQIPKVIIETEEI